MRTARSLTVSRSICHAPLPRHTRPPATHPLPCMPHPTTLAPLPCTKPPHPLSHARLPCHACHPATHAPCHARPPCGQKPWQTLLKPLPCPRLRLWTVKMPWKRSTFASMSPFCETVELILAAVPWLLAFLSMLVFLSPQICEGCVFTGVCLSTGWGGRGRGACMARGGGVHGGGPPGRYYGYGIRWMSGRYASYWNAFLLL